MEILIEENESMEILTEEEAMIVNGGCGGCGSSDSWTDDAADDFGDIMKSTFKGIVAGACTGGSGGAVVGGLGAAIGESCLEIAEDFGLVEQD